VSSKSTRQTKTGVFDLSVLRGELRSPSNPLGGVGVVRPKAEDAAALSQRVSVRLPVADAARWRAAAAAEGVSVSNWVRVRVDASTGAVPVVTSRPAPRRRGLGRVSVPRLDPALIEQLARIGSNVNQLARWANTERRFVVELAVLMSIAGSIDRVLVDATAGVDELGDP
jgi:hypothetical protein